MTAWRSDVGWELCSAGDDHGHGGSSLTALDVVVGSIVELLGGPASMASFLVGCRRWLSAAVCDPHTFRFPIEAWGARLCAQLDARLLRLEEPPEDVIAQDLQIGLEHADEELLITDIAASSPTGMTATLLSYAQQLSNLLTWLLLSRRQPLVGEKSVFFHLELTELRQRTILFLDVAMQFHSRLPDPGLPLRWASWLERAGDTALLPEQHSLRWRQQREQTSSVWANNRRAFLSTVDHVAVLASSLDDLEFSVAEAKEAGDSVCTHAIVAPTEHAEFSG